jgi:hypothetical protein
VPRPSDGAALKWLVILSLVASGLHFGHDAVFLSRYPGPPWIPGPWFAVLAWLVIATLLLLGYRWYRPPSALDALTNGLIFFEGFTGAVLLGYFLARLSRASRTTA